MKARRAKERKSSRKRSARGGVKMQQTYREQEAERERCFICESCLLRGSAMRASVRNCARRRRRAQSRCEKELRQRI